MSETRLPNSDEIATLRAKGALAVSNYSCRLSAGLCSLVYLVNFRFTECIKKILSATSLQDAALREGLTVLLNTLIVSIAIYVFVYAFIALLQSRFYFSLGRVFKRQGSFFQAGRGLSFFKISAILSILSLLSFILIALYVWKEMFIARLGMIENSNFTQITDILRAACFKLSFALAAMLLLPILLVVLYSKLSFLLKHRIRVKRG